MKNVSLVQEVISSGAVLPKLDIHEKWLETVALETGIPVRSDGWSTEKVTEASDDPSEVAAALAMMGVRLPQYEIWLDEEFELNSGRPMQSKRRPQSERGVISALEALDAAGQASYEKCRAEVRAARKLARQAAQQVASFLRQEREAEAKAVAAEKAVVDYTVFAMVDKTKLKMKAALAAAKAQRRSAEALEEMRASKAHWVNVLLFARKEGWGIPEDQRGWTIPGFDWDLQSGGVAK